MSDRCPPSSATGRAFDSHAGTVLCALDELADGQGLPFELGEEPDVLRIVVVRAGDRVRGYHNRCPHFGIPLDIGRGVKTFRQHILCVNHYAVFRFEDGYCIDGPCKGGALTPITLEVSDGSIALGSAPLGE
jgi:nitrite reductase/ring-hydroxylating ferredoxin subunit